MINWDQTFTFIGTKRFLSPGHQLEVYASLSKSCLQPSGTQINATLHLFESLEPQKSCPDPSLLQLPQSSACSGWKPPPPPLWLSPSRRSSWGNSRVTFMMITSRWLRPVSSVLPVEWSSISSIQNSGTKWKFFRRGDGRSVSSHASQYLQRSTVDSARDTSSLTSVTLEIVWDFPKTTIRLSNRNVQLMPTSAAHSV